MTGRMFGGERGAGGARGGGEGGEERGRRRREGEQSDPTARGNEETSVRGGAQPETGGSGLVPGETPRQRKRSRREIEVKEEERRVEREKRENGERGKQTGRIN